MKPNSLFCKVTQLVGRDTQLINYQSNAIALGGGGSFFLKKPIAPQVPKSIVNAHLLAFHSTPVILHQLPALSSILNAYVCFSKLGPNT